MKQSKRKVLVTGGAGRVGYYAIQWAAMAGASVTATASNEEDVAACQAAGAAAVVNHREAAWAEAALAANQGREFDRVIDVEFGANLEDVLGLIRVGGKIVSYSSSINPEPQIPFLRMMYLDLSIQFVIVYAMPEAAKQRGISDIERALHAGQLKHRVAARFPLSEIAAAHELIEAGKCRGCVVVTLP